MSLDRILAGRNRCWYKYFAASGPCLSPGRPFQQPNEDTHMACSTQQGRNTVKAIQRNQPPRYQTNRLQGTTISPSPHQWYAHHTTTDTACVTLLLEEQRVCCPFGYSTQHTLLPRRTQLEKQDKGRAAPSNLSYSACTTAGGTAHPHTAHPGVVQDSSPEWLQQVHNSSWGATCRWMQRQQQQQRKLVPPTDGQHTVSAGGCSHTYCALPARHPSWTGHGGLSNSHA